MNATFKVVYVDQSACTSCQLCAEDLPQVFAMDEADLAFAHNPAGAEQEEIQDAIDSCPGECIHWKE